MTSQSIIYSLVSLYMYIYVLLAVWVQLSSLGFLRGVLGLTFCWSAVGLRQWESVQHCTLDEYHLQALPSYLWAHNLGNDWLTKPGPNDTGLPKPLSTVYLTRCCHSLQSNARQEWWSHGAESEVKLYSQHQKAKWN